MNLPVNDEMTPKMLKNREKPKRTIGLEPQHSHKLKAKKISINIAPNPR